ncbi:hypothetical protein AGLY_003813 [Aphis glycines]|uniref:RRM domain-containing protein n=1 Tax=Aphis glycines TaxID=307491 RepID=A0A6G0TZE8_APHGL|nr:hypothetical protein AGLY_003813 [Aphis glycines]
MFALPLDYVTAQNAGKTFAADYYGRLSVSAESVTDLFTECSRYYSMDSLNGRPTVGRSGAVREVRRFLSTYSGGRRFVKVVSVDAQTDGDERAKKNFGSDDGRSDDDYAFDYDDYGGDHHLAVFVYAELTDPKRPSLAPLPFVQTFRVRWLWTADRGDLFEIVITVVKTMMDAVRPPPAQQQHQLQHLHRLPDDNHNGFSNFGHVENDYETREPGYKQGIYYADNTKQLNAEDREFELWSDVTLPITDDEEQEPPEGLESMREEFLAYLRKVDEFLKKSTVDSDDNVDDDVGTTDRLRVDCLDKSITADQLYTVFSRYGKVLWVRVLPYDYSCSSQYHSALVCFVRNESVDRLMTDHHGFGCTIGGVQLPDLVRIL